MIGKFMAKFKILTVCWLYSHIIAPIRPNMEFGTGLRMLHFPVLNAFKAMQNRHAVKSFERFWRLFAAMRVINISTFKHCIGIEM